MSFMKYRLAAGKFIEDKQDAVSMKHKLSVRINAGDHLSEQCKRCGCEPLLESTTFLKKPKEKTDREITEVSLIKRKNDKCVSAPPVSLLDKEVTYLDWRL
ncbi:hypothetical protein IscW_ISCW003655 [Ixodes scapularis]|uniref:Uncharacterized protein n=1 Tax=Ixodes scapularis TaxID=6945 RepID=B7PJ31_IXOSC|nr:hypothetical protein IscW_ISCW003655 [Ixodes scapularis]|eukprot:XP_002406946.1 hypothetical protein IscW_ISCW003655 [Ixodes scapularis]